MTNTIKIGQKLTFKRPDTPNFLRILENWYDIRNQRIKLHPNKMREQNFETKIYKRVTRIISHMVMLWNMSVSKAGVGAKPKPERRIFKET